MSATDELRRMLDERGIEHDDEFVKSCIPYCDGYEATYWGSDSFGYVEPIRPKMNTIGSHPELTIHDCTPEQAIAAMLGGMKLYAVQTWSDLDDIGVSYIERKLYRSKEEAERRVEEVEALSDDLQYYATVVEFEVVE